MSWDNSGDYTPHVWEICRLIIIERCIDFRHLRIIKYREGKIAPEISNNLKTVPNCSYNPYCEYCFYRSKGYKIYKIKCNLLLNWAITRWQDRMTTIYSQGILEQYVWEVVTTRKGIKCLVKRKKVN